MIVKFLPTLDLKSLVIKAITHRLSEITSNRDNSSRLIVKFRAGFIETTSNNINDIARLIVKFLAHFWLIVKFRAGFRVRVS